MDSPYEINPAGFTIHSAIHAAREDAKCVLHMHSLNGVAVSAQKGGVLPISQQSIFVLASLGYHDYEGVALHEDEKPRLVRDLGDKQFLMLRNHGLLTVGDTIADAFLFMYLFEAACTIQVRAQAGGGELIPIDPRIIAGATQQAKVVTRGAGGGAGLAGAAAQAGSSESRLRGLRSARERHVRDRHGRADENEDHSAPDQALLSLDHEEPGDREERERNGVRVGGVGPCLLAAIQVEPVRQAQKEARILAFLVDMPGRGIDVQRPMREEDVELVGRRAVDLARLLVDVELLAAAAAIASSSPASGPSSTVRSKSLKFGSHWPM